MVRVLFSLMFTYSQNCCISIKCTALDLIIILFLDSLKTHDKFTVAELIRKWLNFEWNRSLMRDAKGFKNSPFNKDSMELKSPKGKSTV
jgi:hypothetical protein